MNQRFELLTPAKINLFLHIVGRRPDGYHELDSLFLPISLCDRIAIQTAPAASAAVSLRCNWPEMPLDRRNLAVRAAHLFMEQTGLRLRVAIDLDKRIPAGAGLGGGSSDAGAVLRAMASLHGIEPAALASAAVKVGADVPFFLDPRPARVGGIGERITYVKGDFGFHLVVGVPPVMVPTAEIYRHLEQGQWSGAGPSQLPVLGSGSLPRDLLINDLEAVAVARYPQIGEVKVTLENLGSLGTAMSGSGGAVFAIFSGASEAQTAAELAAAQAPWARFHVVQVLAGDA
jgi:4-diphosphocytidyl-2-C-methyl-D-erythritol kinase